VLGGRANAMFEGLRQAGKRGQIKDSGEANFSVLNAPYRLLSGSETDFINLIYFPSQILEAFKSTSIHSD
jgi:hypothetical protein